MARKKNTDPTVDEVIKKDEAAPTAELAEQSTEKDQVDTTNTVQPKKTKPKTLSQPFFSTTVELRSLQAQRVHRRTFRALSGSLFRSDVIVRIFQDDKAADALEEAIKALVEPVSEDLNTAIEQAKVLIKKHSIQSLPEYTYPRKFNIEIKSPQIASYANMLSKLDVLMIYLDGLWIWGAIDNKSRQHQTYDWQQRIIKLANRIINIERHARKRADELGKKDQVEALAPSADLDQAQQDLNNENDSDDDESTTDAGSPESDKSEVAA